MSAAELKPQDYVGGILNATAEYRIADCDRLAAEAREALPPVTLVREVFSPVLHEAGDRWEKGQFSVVQEHMLSSAVRRQLAYALDMHNRATAPGPCLAYTTLSGERHEIGSLMLALIGASSGVRAFYLGPDLPVAEVGRFCAHIRVAAVAISVVTSPEVIDAERQLRELRAVLPEPIEIWLGGQATQQMRAGQLPARCVPISELADFQRRLEMLSRQGDRQ